jgi:hypothetical protein
MRVMAAALVLLVAVSCLSRRSPPSGREPERLELRVEVELDEEDPFFGVTLMGPDGGVVFTGSATVPDGGFGFETVSTRDLSGGPGRYALTLGYRAADGGEAATSGYFDLTGAEARIEGSVRIPGGRRLPEVRLELLERAPAGLRLEPTSDISAEGAARYDLVNDSDRPQRASLVRPSIERWSGSEWVRQTGGRPACGGPSLEQLPSGKRQPVEVGGSECLSKRLAAGTYRHLFHLFEPERRGPDRSSPTLVYRTMEVVHAFEVSADRPLARIHAFPNVPVRDLQLQSTMALADDVAFELMAPDGGTACVCAGTLVGRERQTVVHAGGNRLCFASHPDASVVACEQVDDGRNGLGDYPPYGRPWDRGVPAPKW